MKKIVSAFLSVAVTASIAASGLFAEESYIPYNYDSWGDSIASQTGYTADTFISGDDIGCGPFDEITDIFVTEDERMFIADRGNNRIVVTDLEFNLITEISEFDYNGTASTLSGPMGLYVDPATDYIYIADYGNERVVKTDIDGNVSMEFYKPESNIYGAETTYNPEKVLVDKAENVYVVIGSVTRGAVMYNKKGEFLGFYGANRVEQTAEVLSNAFWSLFSTEKQLERTTRNAPVGFSNFDIDEKGFIYTVTDSPEVTTDVFKKLNPEGENILDAIVGSDKFFFGDIPPAYWSIYANNSVLTDVDIGPNGEINILDFENGRVFQYDKECWLLFIMGGEGKQVGKFLSPTAIESSDNKIFVSDSRKNTITVFTRNAFGEIVTEAAGLYNEGKYIEAQSKWENVLKYDGNYKLAYLSIGNALFNQDRYEDALEYYEIVLEQDKYDRTYEEIRDTWISDNYVSILIAIGVLIAIGITIHILRKKRIIRF